MAFIYALEDPRDGELRYIGYTCKSPQRRWNEHFYDATKTAKSHRYDWLRLLRREGLKPRGRVIVECSEEEAPLLERICIAVYRALGFDLVNGTDGGDGVHGHVYSEETRAKMAASARGNHNGLGYKHTPEERAKMSAAQKLQYANGKRPPSRKGTKASPETKAKMAESQRLRYQQHPELRAVISEAVKWRRWNESLEKAHEP